MLLSYLHKECRSIEKRIIFEVGLGSVPKHPIPFMCPTLCLSINGPVKQNAQGFYFSNCSLWLYVFFGVLFWCYSNSLCGYYLVLIHIIICSHKLYTSVSIAYMNNNHTQPPEYWSHITEYNHKHNLLNPSRNYHIQNYNTCIW